ncbi:MAG: NAD(P)H-dependent oxidoreductase [Alphaproteobacteria bacterium]
MPHALSAMVVYCHPVAESYAAAVRDRVIATLARTGVNAVLFDLYADGFVPVLGREERLAHLDPALRPPDLEDQFAALARADLLIFIYPTWWYGLPAMLKGWLDRVLRAGVAFRLPEGADLIEPMLTQVRQIAVVTTYGSPWWLIRFVGDAGRRTIARGLQLLCPNARRALWLGLYGMDKASDEDRRRFLDRVDRKLAQAVRRLRRRASG